MIIESIRIGIIAAIVVTLPQMIRAHLPGEVWVSPLMVLGIGLLGLLLFQSQKLGGNLKKSEDLTGSGLSDLLLYVHSPLSRDSHRRWFVQALISFLLALFGGRAGTEGASIELLHGMHLKWRSSATRWFEQRRRSQIGSILAASLAAAFGAPFAGLMFSVELGVGGRTVSIVLSSIIAWMGAYGLQSIFHLPVLFDFKGSVGEISFLSGGEWLGFFILGVLCGGFGILVLGFIRYAQEGFQVLARSHRGWRVGIATLLLSAVLWMGRLSDSSPGAILADVWLSNPSSSDLLVLGLAQFLMLSLLVSGFGTLGWLWPLFILGSVFGLLLHSLILYPVTAFALVSGLLGAAGVWSAVLHTPLTCGVLVFEMTHQPQMLFPALLVGGVASWISQRAVQSSFFENLFQAQGFSLKGGRSSRVLESISVQDAMVTDFEVILENESIAELQLRMFRSPYPFFPVVNDEGTYQGMLTLDTLLEIEEGAFLGTFLEAKDLLYREGVKVPVVHSSDLLASTAGYFESVPCVAVVNEAHQLMGLLFVYHVRLAYDREVTRRSSDFVPKDEG